MLALDLLAGAASVAVLTPASLLCLEVGAAMLPHRPRRLDDVARPRLAVLVPAHDEAGGIHATLEALRPQLLPGDRLVVVADNCSDATALIARRSGATVLERHDPVRRGKGYALDYGLQFLQADPPEVVIVVDADCDVAPGVLGHLARQCVASGRPVQALYLMEPAATGGRLAPLAEFAWIVRNHARPLGCLHLGWPCQLMGTGMALPWLPLSGVSLADGHIVEDINLGMNLARAGAAPLFCPEARVSSRFPANPAGQAQQRRRWEHGHLGMIFSAAPRALWQAMRQRQPPLALLALDMCVPPLAFLVLACMAALGLAAVTAFFGGASLPLYLASAAVALVVLAVGSAWQRFGRATLSAGQLLLAPLYALRKLPLYLGFLRKRQVAWVRTDRGAGPPPP